MCESLFSSIGDLNLNIFSHLFFLMTPNRGHPAVSLTIKKKKEKVMRFFDEVSRTMDCSRATFILGPVRHFSHL